MKHKSTVSTKNDAKRKKVENSAEEKRLEELLFGKIEVGNSAKKAEDVASFEEDGDLDSNKQEDEEAGDYEDINFTIDTKPDLALVEQNKLPENNEGQAAWHDEDDEDLVIDLNQTNRLKKLAYSDKNVQNKTVVTGKEYSELLKQRFDASQKKNVWANPNLLRQALKRKSDDDDDDTERYLDDEDYQLLQEAESMTVKRGKSDANKWLPLTDGKIIVHRLQDITFEEAASSPITSTHFHRDQSLVLVASDDKHLRLFRMNEENSQNKKVLNMQFNDLTIKNAKFLGSQHEELIVCGRRPYYYCYNLQSGQVTKIPKSLGIETTSLEHMSVSPEGGRIGFVGSHGYIHIVDSNTKQWAMDMKMNSTLKSLSFLSEYECVSSGFDADIYFWDLRFPNGKCINKFQHEDGTATSHLSTYLPPQHSSTSSYNYYSLPNAFLSVGAISGVNSIYEGFFQTNSTVHDFTASPYDESDVKGRKFGGTPKPLKSVMNLTTKITTSSFHPSGQILAIASHEKKDQLKLVHLPSCSVFQNWPLSSTPLHNVQTVEFSGNGKYMSIGNKRGKVLLYQLNHFL